MLPWGDNESHLNGYHGDDEHHKVTGRNHPAVEGWFHSWFKDWRVSIYHGVEGEAEFMKHRPRVPHITESNRKQRNTPEPEVYTAFKALALQFYPSCGPDSTTSQSRASSQSSCVQTHEPVGIHIQTLTGFCTDDQVTRVTQGCPTQIPDHKTYNCLQCHGMLE